MARGIYLIPDVLTSEECTFFKDRIDKRKSRPHHSFVAVGNFYNEKVIDTETSDFLYGRVKDHLPGHFAIVAASPYTTYAKYEPGQSFGIHTDTGIERPERGLESKCTMLVYLNDDFEGGETRFYDNNFRATDTVVPKRGSALVFDIALWHEAQQIDSGNKYWVGTELMCEYH